MKQFEYMFLKKKFDSCGHKWQTCTQNKEFVGYSDMPITSVLNALGVYGWELCCCDCNKESFYLKRGI